MSWNIQQADEGRSLYHEIIDGEGPAIIATIYNHGATGANAALIAAAPELLAAVEWLLREEGAWHNAVETLNGDGHSAPAGIGVAIELARDAAAKARGQI